MSCINAFGGLPDTCLDGNGLILPSGIAFTPENQEFDTLADAGDDDNWKSDIVDNLISFVHGVKEVEDMSGDDAVYESPGQDKIKLFSGKVSLKFSVYVSVDTHKRLLSYSGKKGRLYIYDRNNNIMGTSNGTNFRGWKLSYINVGDLKVPTDASPAWTTIEVQFANNSEFNEELHVINPSINGTAANQWYPYDLPTLGTVTVEQVGTVTATDLVIDVFTASNSYTDNDGDPISVKSTDGLDVTTFTNFIFTISGTVTAPQSMTDDGVVDGKARYTAVFTAISAGDTVQITPTADAPFESSALTVT